MSENIKINRLNPFPGLRPFLPEESDLFFGREGESEEVVGKLLRNRFITVMGASGTGKSSLIYCGVLPKVKMQTSEANSAWKILTFRPGNDPLANLTDVLTQAVPGGEKNETLRHEISTALTANPNGLSLLVKNLLIRNNEKVLVLVDQFEELFRYSITGSGSIPGRNATKFVSLLEEAVQQSAVPLYVIITMRSDFIGECAHFPGFTQLINSSNYLVPHMGRENYRSAIEGPVKYAGAQIDPKLTETLLNDIGDQTDQLPVLQHALMRTWAYWQELDEPGRPISFSDYDSVGTMSGAMSRHANEAYEELTQRGREICEKTFRTITEKGADNKGVRHPSKVGAIKSIIGCSSDELFDVLAKFRIVSRSFLTPREGVDLDDDSVIDVSHESLMRLWDRLKQWVDEESSSVQMYMRLAEASAMYQQGKTTLWRPPDLQLAVNWRNQQKPTLQWAERYDPAFERAMVYLRTSEKEFQAEEENKIRLQKRQIKRARIIAIILGTAAIISVFFMLFAFVQQIATDRARQLADENAEKEKAQREIADSTTKVAIQARIEADSSKNVAVMEKTRADSSANVARTKEQEARVSAIEATRQRGRAEEQADLATRESTRARQQEQIATTQKIEAERLKMLAIGKQMSIKSMQVQGQRDLQTLLAYQAYLFNARNKGVANDADIYQGLYNVAKQTGNVNYKQFRGHTGEIKSVAFVPGKKEFYTSDGNGKVLKGNLDSPSQNLQIIYTGTGEIIEVLAISPDATWLACGGNNSVIRMIPIKEGTSSMAFELKGHSDKLKSLVFSYDGQFLYSASLDGKVLKWDLAARTSTQLGTDNIRITSIDVSSNGNYIAGVTSDSKALIWNPERSGDNFRIETPQGKKVKILRFRPDENTIAVGYEDGNIELWNVETHQRISILNAHTAEVNDIRFNSREFQMATASKDGSLKLWDTRDLTTPPITFTDNEGFVMVVEFSPDGQIVVSGAYEGSNNLVGRPTGVGLLALDVCKMLQRNMTPEEWSTYVGKDVEYQKTCSEKELSIKVNAIKQ